MFDKYKPVELPTKPNADSVQAAAAKPDTRLPAEEMVLGVYIGGRANPRAYPLADLERMGQVRCVTRPLRCGSDAVILWDGRRGQRPRTCRCAEKREPRRRN